MSKLSILIPIYNVEKFLPSCLDSVLNQTMSDIEIICINDGSTDSCGDILSDYAGRDSRIKVITKSNSGYGHTMNVGLEAATGEYVGIVESDDMVEPDFFANLYKVALEHDLDIAKGECKFVWPSEDYSYIWHQDGLDKYYDRIIPKERLWLRCQFLMNIWTCIYRRKILIDNNIRFNETPGASYQDNGFWMQGMIYADRVMVIRENGYLYRQDNSAASVKDSRKVYAMVDEYSWLAGYLQDRISRQQMDVVNAFRLIRGYWSFYRIDDSRKREFCDRLISDYQSYGSVFTTDLLWQERFYQVMDDPDKFCNDVITVKKELESQIAEAKGLVIYGAGKRGQRLFRLFCDYGFRKKLQCFVETNDPGDKKVARVPAYKIDDPAVDWEYAAVIISASGTSKVAAEMLDKCREIGIRTILSSDGFFDNYYTLT